MPSSFARIRHRHATAARLVYSAEAPPPCSRNINTLAKPQLKSRSTVDIDAHCHYLDTAQALTRLLCWQRKFP
jgi:hypothetical protein